MNPCRNCVKYQKLTKKVCQTPRLGNFNKVLLLSFNSIGLLPMDHSLKTIPDLTKNRGQRLSISKPPPSCSLQHEFSLLNTNIPHIDIEVLDPVKRNATVRISANGHIIMLQVLFPMGYPSIEQLPEFTYCQGTSIATELSDSLMKVLQNCATERTKKGRTCLEQCLRELVTALKNVSNLVRYGVTYDFRF